MKGDTTFERLMLKDAVKEARKLGATVFKAWVHRCCGSDTWEFRYDGFYTHFRAENAWHARALGWEAWIEKQKRATNGTQKRIDEKP